MPKNENHGIDRRAVHYGRRNVENPTFFKIGRLAGTVSVVARLRRGQTERCRFSGSAVDAGRVAPARHAPQR